MGEAQLIEQIKQARHEKSRLQIIGNQSKVGLSEGVEALSLSQHEGIVEYSPEELVVTVKTGTKLVDLSDELARHQQTLAFDPPDYGDSTLGGTYAFGLSGPSQPFYGSFRDYVLGIKMIDGRGQVLHFGGKMIKNVAGYDVSRMMSGSKGLFGVITEISLKLTPLKSQKTYSIECGQTDAIVKMNELACSSLPLSAAAYFEGKLYYRLDGVHSTQSAMPEDNHFWQTINPYRPNLKASQKLWRVSVDATAPTLPNTVLIDQSGIRRWIISEQPPVTERADLWETHGDKVRFPDAKTSNNTELLKEKLRSVFDPDNVFY